VNYGWHFYCGLDLGQSNEYTALAVIEEAVWIDANMYVLENYGLLSLELRGGIVGLAVLHHAG
jgi:hypothetical protein